MEDYVHSRSKKKEQPIQKKERAVVSKWGVDWEIIFNKDNKKIRNQILIFLFCFVCVLSLSLRYYWREKRWRFIVIHHTASDIGNLEYYKNLHQKRWGDLAYHILINNGSNNTTAGQIEYSNLWLKRKHHYSTKNTYLNYFGIAIVLVGDFEKHEVPQVQKDTLIKLLANLAREYGIPSSRIIGHREVGNTKCPGFYINMVEIRYLVSKALGE